jgi:FMN phosphatase YigB (HAD superfamily)
VPTRAEAVTFDFWNTLMWEEPGSLKEKRLEVWADAFAKMGAAFEPVQLEQAHDAAHQAYVESWIAGRQFRAEEAAEHMASRLNGDLEADVERALIDGFNEGGRRAAIHPSEGVRECLEALKGADVRIGVICDIGLTPSPVVGELLARHGLHAFIDSMSFSDEVGHYKPARPIFDHALTALGGVVPVNAAHVGDRRRTDVAGAIAMGMTAVRYNGVYEDEAVSAPEGDIVLTDLAELPSLLGVAR